MSLSDRIRILLIKRGNISEAELARRLGVSPQNLNNKMKRDNFTEKDLQEIANALDCTYTVTFTMNDTGENV
ncbi:MAG: helix-turn-helix transcriptional regulator [Clostridia bacterium]|nr:helix-turn-helix transcriptional regulator [Clostridia bacterium]